jgi:hypothetical protein
MVSIFMRMLGSDNP